ncbi:MAG: NifB/NifX family molybdenum-iron cluster-binding protein [Candidatus Cloacimonadales bacterium]
MQKIIVAFATNDGTRLNDDHFGAAALYSIYEIDSSGYKFLKSLANSTAEEEIHADPKKAKGVSRILRDEKVIVAGSKVFGPNLQRIKQKFVCVFLQNEIIEEAAGKLSENFALIQLEWNKGEARDHLVL